MNKELILQYLDKLISSDVISRSQLSCKLMQFLIESTLNNDTIKEYTIGEHLFGNDFDLEKSDSKVRVKVYQLRQYLQKYYETEGKNDAIRFEIEKGQYLVSFIDNTSTEKWNFFFSKNKILLVISIFILVLIVVAFIVFKKEKIPYWEDFFENDETTALIVGDIFSFLGPGIKNEPQVIRDYNINNEDDFKQYLNNYPDLKGKYKEADYSYLSQMTPYVTYSFSKLFFENRHQLNILMGSKCSIELLKSTNTIFIGMPKTMGNLLPLFNEINNSSIHINMDAIIFNSADKTQYKEYIAGSDNEMDIDYALVSFFKKPGGKNAFLFVSYNDIGIIGAVNYFTNKEKLTFIKSRLPEGTKFFTAIVKTTGKDRSEIGVELIHIDPIINNIKTDLVK
ncbi:MAG: hypothetical protein JW717_06885 [Marinilabiliaceae bacterium]|nr:hypothetical protein [Marinilabiliaceae bacterium]